MTKNRDEKKYELERELDDLRAFDGNEAKIKRIENRLHEIEIEEEFEEYKNKYSRKILCWDDSIYNI